eukprot:jgi/Botrbrau1/22784/Bobra.0132s0110.1
MRALNLTGSVCSTSSRASSGNACLLSSSHQSCYRIQCSRPFNRRACLHVAAVAMPQVSSPHSTASIDRDAVVSSVKSFLETEINSIFSVGTITRERYAPTYRFEDPIVRYEGIDAFELNLRLLRTIFQVSLCVHKVEITGPTEITSRWTMTLKPRLLAWRPPLTFTGQSKYGVNTFDGRLLYQIDTWDSIYNNQFPSVEGYFHLARQLGNPQTTPDLETPTYRVLKKTAEYEIREYDPFLVAETSMPLGVGPASGDGFQTLASYLFGANNRNKAMEMTTPVINTVKQGEVNENMQFVMEKELGQAPDDLPAPRDNTVVRKKVDGGIVAASSFSGLPLDFEVVEKERRLRAALLLDGLKPEEGYRLARYNDPFTPPPIRRNEVLIKLESFEL